MLEEHLGYVSDVERLSAYKTAIERVVGPGACVADLGCGSGVLGLMCLQAGAARAYEVDATAMIEVAREAFARVGLAERAMFVQGRSDRVELPELADVVICDHVGYFGFDYGIVDLLSDARQRLLKPGGAVIPKRLVPQVALVESERCRSIGNAWRAPAVPSEFHWLRDHYINARHALSLTRGELLGAPVALDPLDLGTESREFLSWTVELCADRDGAIDGIAGWFACELADGVWMSNSPLAERPIKRCQAFLPLGEPVRVARGDRVRFTIMARPSDHVISWTIDSDGGQRQSHSTWRGELLTPADLARRNPAHVPQLRAEAGARKAVLQWCDGRRTIREIERELQREFPDLFSSAGAVSRFVFQTLARDSE